MFEYQKLIIQQRLLFYKIRNIKEKTYRFFYNQVISALFRFKENWF